MGIAENMDIQQYMATVGEQARGASRAMARATAGDKNAALSAERSSEATRMTERNRAAGCVRRLKLTG